MDLVAIEFFLILVVVLLQLYLGFTAKSLINNYKSAFIHTPTIQKYDGSDEEHDLGGLFANADNVSMTLLKFSSLKDGHMKMVNLINKYLYNNQGAVIDYHFIKEIVDRERSTAENAIDSYIPSPLYFGLAATMIGIIIGLFGIDFTTTEIGAIEPLINGVKMAMFASVLGLTITTYLAVFAYRSAKTKVDAGVNDLLSLIQIELLPSFHKDENSSLDLLSRKLDDFGRTTSHQLGLMEKLVKESRIQVNTSNAVISKISEIDLTNIAGANVKIFKQLSKMMDSFENFAGYYTNLNKSLGSTTQLVSSLNQLNERSEQVSEIFNELKAINGNAHSAAEFFRSHIEDFSKYGKAVNLAVESSDEAMQKAIETFNNTSREIVGGIKEQMQTYDEKFTDIITSSSDTFVQKAEGQRVMMLEALERSSPEFSHLKELSTIKNELSISNEHSVKTNSTLNNLNLGISKLRESIDNNRSYSNPISTNVESSQAALKKGGFKNRFESILRLTMYSVVIVMSLTIIGVIIFAALSD